MPTFSTSPSGNLTESIRKMIASGGAQVTPVQEMQADHMAAETVQKLSLAAKARAEVEAMQAAAAQRANPATRTEFAAHTAGINLPEANRLMGAIRGQLEQPGPSDVDDAAAVGAEAQPFVMAKPNLQPGQERQFRSALAAAVAGNLATGHTNADQLTQATGNVQQQGITEAVQAAIARGDVQGASAANQGAKPGTQIKLFDNVGSTGATFAPATGTVNADPKTDPTNALLAGNVDELKAKAERERAAAAKLNAEKNKTGEKPRPEFKDITTLRKEFNDQTEVKAYRDIIPIIESARSTPDTRAGDIQIAYAVGKILDPASVVREGELKMSAEAQTTLAKYWGEMQSAVTGKGRLSPETRARLVSMLDTAVAQREASYKATEATYRGIAEQNGFPIDQVIINPPKRGGQPGQPAGEVQAKKKIGNVEFVKIGGKWFQP